MIYVLKPTHRVFAEVTECAAELSEFSLPQQHTRNIIPPVSYSCWDCVSALVRLRFWGGGCGSEFDEQHLWVPGA